MKSLREIADEITGTRLSMANSSIWNINATIRDRVDVAINDALRTYGMYIERVATSFAANATIIPLPKDADNVTSIVGVGTAGRRVPIHEYDHLITPHTNMVQVFRTAAPVNTSYTEVKYSTRLKELPSDAFLVTSISDTIRGANVSGTIPSHYYKAPGWLEITVDNTLGREVVYYEYVTLTGFTGITRGIEGQAVNWPAGARISSVLPVEADALGVIVPAAQAVMFEYWMTHRAQYDLYIAANNIAGVELSDVAAIVRTYQEKAERQYKHVKKAPPPGRASR